MKRKEQEDWELTGNERLGTAAAVVEAFKLLQIHSRVVGGLTAEQELQEARALHLQLTKHLTAALRSLLGAQRTEERLALHYLRGKKGTALTAPTKMSSTKRLKRSSGWSARQLKLFEDKPEKPKLPKAGPSLH